MPATTTFNPVTHVIFDLDGLLLDTEHIYESTCREIIESFGKKYLPETRIKVMGTTELKTCETVVNDLSLPITVEEFHQKWNEVCSSRFRTVNMMKGAEELIHHLMESSIPFSLGTSSTKEMAELKMSSHQKVFDLFHHKVYGSDPEVKNGKPAPDTFLLAAKRFDDTPDPSKCLVFEDSSNGVLAAANAGMQVVMVPDKVTPEEKRKKATIVLDSLEDFQPELFGLPKYAN